MSIADLVKTHSMILDDSSVFLEIWKGYDNDANWHQMMNKTFEFKGFSIVNGLLCHSNESRAQLLVIPDMNHKGEGVRSMIIETIHKIVGHYSHPNTLKYMRNYYW